MAEITAALVKELRERTGAGMMDCKKALGETAGDIEAAIDWLRTKGLAAAAKKAGRVAAEGLVGVAADGTARRRGRGQRRDRLRRPQRAVPGVRRAIAAQIALDNGGDLAEVAGGAVSRHRPRPSQDELTAPDRHDRREHDAAPRRHAVGRPTASSPATCTTRWRPTSARSACWWRSNRPATRPSSTALGKQLAMHVAAANPLSLTVDDLDPAVVERERGVLTEKAAPERQARRHRRQDGRGRHAQVLRGSGAARAGLRDRQQDQGRRRWSTTPPRQVGAPVTSAGFVRFPLGEGIEKKSEDFAAEVAAQLKK